MVTPINQLKPGDFIVPYEVIQSIKFVPASFLENLAGGGPMVFQELEEEKVITSKPWMGGMPYKILDISPPLILASAVNNELGKTPPLFFDASAVTFIKVPDKFKRLWAQEYAAYYKATKKKIVPTVDKSGVELTTYKPLSFEDQLQSLMDQVTEKKEDDKP